MICSSCGSTVAEGTAFCTACGRPIVGYSVAGSAAGGAASISVPGAVTGAATDYAGFWLRFVAIIIDGIVLGVFGGVVFFVVLGIFGVSMRSFAHPDEFGPAGFAPAMFGAIFLVEVFLLVVHWLYFALLESSSWQATLGKKALGLYVTDLGGNRVSFGRATGRFFSKLISGFTLCIGYIMAGFTEKKQALHDMVASCLVLRKI